MKALPLQSIQINLDFRSNKDLVEIFDQLRREIRSGEKQVSSHVNGCRYSMKILEDPSKIKLVDPVKEERKSSRIETLNGKLCLIIPSKLNDEKEI